MRAGTEQSYQARIGRVLAHIDANLDGDLELAGLARVAHFSPYHFHRVFRGMVGEPVKEHIRRRRLERAAGRLCRSGQTVTEIALDAGYESPEAFTRAFESRYQLAPSAYRRQARDVVLRRRSGERVAAVRHVGPYDEVGSAWQTLMAWAGPQRLFSTLGIVIDDPEATPPEEQRYDAAVVLRGEMTPPEPMRVVELEGGEYAVTLHTGTYSGLGAVYAAVCGGWLPDSGRELRDAPSIEVYLNAPGMVRPDELRTEIWLPLEES
jgi:AraC family transcriptional regulator